MNSRQIQKLILILAVFGFITISSTTGALSTPQKTYDARQQPSNQQATPSNAHDRTQEITPKSPPAPHVPHNVLRVIDGDTIVVDMNGTSEKVRLIGINAPELHGSPASITCFGKEASDHLRYLLENNVVYLETDASQDTRDRYGRLLAYVILGKEGLNLNEHMLKEGFAREYTHRKPYHHQREFKKAEQNAQAEKQGLWSACFSK